MSTATWGLIEQVSKGKDPLDGQIVSKGKTQVFVAIRTWTSKDNKTYISTEDRTAILAKGWEQIEGFNTTASDNAKWEWIVLTKQLPAGPISLPEFSALDALKKFYFQSAM